MLMIQGSECNLKKVPLCCSKLFVLMQLCALNASGP